MCNGGQRVDAVQVNLTPLISRDALATDATAAVFSLLVSASAGAGERDPLQMHIAFFIVEQTRHIRLRVGRKSGRNPINRLARYDVGQGSSNLSLEGQSAAEFSS